MASCVVEYYRLQALVQPDKPAFFSGAPDFKQTLSWKEVWYTAQNLAYRMQLDGVNKDDRIGILSQSCAQWEMTQLASFLSGGVVVGLDPHDNVASYEYIIKKCGIKYIYVNGNELLAKISPLVEKYHFIVKQMESSSNNATPITEMPIPEADKMATVVFTSGTNFEPKGIEYTHGQVVLTVETILQSFPQIEQGSQTTCWLPLSNLFQRIINFTSAAVGGKIYFVANPQEVMRHLKVTNPHVFIGVPRFYEKVYDGMISKISKSMIFRAIFYLASIPARQRSSKIQHHQTIGPILNFFWCCANWIVFNKIKRLFGKNIQFAISGSAPMRRNVLEFFHMIDILILEAYGTSENIIPIAANRIGSFKFGSVGIPLIKDSVILSEDNEILIKSPGVFKGYLDVPSATSFSGGYYKTSDLGHFDQDGFLYIEGRKSEVFKTTTGKKISAVEIDDLFKSIPYVDVALTLGENRKAPVVLITLDFQCLAQVLNVHVDDLWDLEDGNFVVRVLQHISRDLSQKNAEVPEKMRPVGFIVLTRKFIMENQEVTTSFKIRRRHIEKKLIATLDKLYLEIDGGTKLHFWFLNSQDFQVTVSEDTKITYTAAGRMLGIINLFIDVIQTTISYRLQTRSQTNLNRKLGQIFRQKLGRLRGPLQKVGQMLSYMHEDLPQEFREEVSELLRNSPPINPFLIRSIVESELKQPIPLLFAEWKDTPLHTASIGQVHFARLHSGEAVAVKVLLPKMEQITRSDLFLLQMCLPIIQRILKNPTTRVHFEELKSLISKECDFLNEAKYYDMFRDLFKNNPDIIIPEVKHDLCTSKVLVTSYVEGITLEQFIHHSEVPQRQKIAEIIWRFNCEAINRFAVFNADPHPGNYIICGDKVGVVDFGFCKMWKNGFIESWKKQTLAGCRGDEKEFIKATRAMGYNRPGDPDFIKNLMPIHREVFYCPWMEDKDFKITHQYLKTYLKTIFERIVSPGNVHLPTDLLALIRLYFEVFAIMAELDVEFNYYRATIPYIEEHILVHKNPNSAPNILLLAI